MTRDQARRACEALVATLDLPEPFDIEEFCRRLGRQRGKPLMLMPTPMAMGGGLCGLWLGTATRDYVFYEQETSPLHQQHIVFHEVGHILRRHPPRSILGLDIARALAPSVEPGEVQRVLGRDTYTDEHEYEAELIATLILRRIGQSSDPEPAPTANEDEDTDDPVLRIEQTLRRRGRR